MNPFLERHNSKFKPGRLGKISEKKVSKSLGARLTPNSGAMNSAKGDASLGSYLLEMKSTNMQSIALKLEWLNKISKEALDQNKIPGVVISFVDGQGNPVSKFNSEWVCIPKSVFQEVVE